MNEVSHTYLHRRKQSRFEVKRNDVVIGARAISSHSVMSLTAQPPIAARTNKWYDDEQIPDTSNGKSAVSFHPAVNCWLHKRCTDSHHSRRGEVRGESQSGQ